MFKLMIQDDLMSQYFGLCLKTLSANLSRGALSIWLGKYSPKVRYHITLPVIKYLQVKMSCIPEWNGGERNADLDDMRHKTIQ
jgi:hypothetical protein